MLLVVLSLLAAVGVRVVVGFVFIAVTIVILGVVTASAVIRGV